MKTQIDIKTDFITVYELLRSSSFEIPEKEWRKNILLMEHKEPITNILGKDICQNIVDNIWENYPFKALVFHQQLNGFLVPTEYTNNIILCIKEYVEGVWGNYEPHGYFEDFRFEIFIIKPSQKGLVDVSRIQQF